MEFYGKLLIVSKATFSPKLFLSCLEYLISFPTGFTLSTK